jgi:DNA invertase Pin-like site-specific DNA recombinase
MSNQRFAGLRVATYARFSSANQRETSIEDQQYRCHQFVEQHGGTAIDTVDGS